MHEILAEAIIHEEPLATANAACEKEAFLANGIKQGRSLDKAVARWQE